jgi:hypothetical protein
MCDFSDYINTQVAKNCLKKSTCSFDYDITYVQKNCKYYNKYNYFYFSYECFSKYNLNVDQYVNLNYIVEEINIDRQVWAFAIVGTDIASITVLLICMIVISLSQRRLEENYNNNNILISDYTVRVSNIKLSFSNIDSELNDLVKHFRMLLATEKLEDKVNMFNFKGTSEYYTRLYADCEEKISKEYINNTEIYDINYPIITDSKLNLILRYQQLHLDKKKLQRKFKLTETEKAKTKVENYIIKLDKEIIQTQNKIKRLDKTELENIKEIFITFRNQKIADFYIAKFKKNKCKRCCYIFCCQFSKIKNF